MTEHAAAAAGADEARVREALAALEAEGKVYRGITVPAWCLTADGRDPSCG